MCVPLTPHQTTDDREEGHARGKFTFKLTNILANLLLNSFDAPVTSRVVRRIGGWSEPPRLRAHGGHGLGVGRGMLGWRSGHRYATWQFLCLSDSVHAVPHVLYRWMDAVRLGWFGFREQMLY